MIFRCWRATPKHGSKSSPGSPTARAASRFGAYTQGLYRVAIIESGPGRLFAGYEDFAVKTNETTIREATAWAAYAAPLTLTLVNPPEELRGGKVEWEAGLRAEPLGPRYPGNLDNLQRFIMGHGLAARTVLDLPPGEWALLAVSWSTVAGRRLHRASTDGGPSAARAARAGEPARLRGAVEVRVGFGMATLTGKVKGETPRICWRLSSGQLRIHRAATARMVR
ncbi:MAG: hypothetical protein R2724_15925 [Bryobacterales bacterium]